MFSNIGVYATLEDVNQEITLQGVKSISLVIVKVVRVVK